MAAVVPTLSSNGWVRSPAEKADFLLAHFYEGDKFQTYLYGENVTNLQWCIEKWGHNIVALCDQIKRALEVYMGRYFDSASVQVTSNDNRIYNAEPNQSSEITLRVVIDVTENGQTYSVARLIVASDSKFQRVINLNNDGQLTA